MATKQSATTKKAKTATAAAKKAPSRQVRTRVSTTKSSQHSKKPTAKNTRIRSFRRSPQTEPFMQVRFTLQSLYWLILGGVIIAFGLWLASLQMEISRIYDRIDQSQIQSQALDEKELQILKNKQQHR